MFRLELTMKCFRYLPQSHNTELIISDIRESDAGTYLVKATNDNFSGSAAILLLVQRETT